MEIACLEHSLTPTLQTKLVNSMTSRQAKLQEKTYVRVMRNLQEKPNLTRRGPLQKLDISLGKLNYWLNVRMKMSLVKTKKFTDSKNKFGCIYLYSPSGLAEKAAITQCSLLRNTEEFVALKAEIEALMFKVEKLSGNVVQKS